MMHGTIMEGEGGDRLVTRNNRDWRVRIRKITEIPAQAPTNGAVELAPTTFGVSVSVAALDDQGAVTMDASGRPRVFDAHVLTFQTEQLVRADFDPTALINDVIDRQIAEAEAMLSGLDKLASIFGE